MYVCHLTKQDNRMNIFFRTYISAIILFVTLISLPVLSYAGGAPFSIKYISGEFNAQGEPVLFNMVAGSTQQLKFDVYSTTGSVTVIKCALNSSTKDSVKLDSGCTNKHGAGATPTLPIPIVITLTAGAATGNVTHTFTIQDLSGRNVKTYQLNYTIVANATRTITFENYCPFPVWFGVVSGTLPAKHPATSCTSNAQCPDGTECRTGKCFWNVPAPNKAVPTPNKNYELDAYTSGAPASNSITLTDYNAQNKSTKVWSGGFAGRTGCSFTGGVISCVTGDCGDDGTGKGGCALGTGFSAPITQIEPTFLSLGPDTYDVEVINGFNIPASIAPTSIPVGSNSPYDCGTAGKTTSTPYTDIIYIPGNGAAISGSMGACDWTFTPPSLHYQWVDGSTATSCSSNATCAPNACGLTTANVVANSSALTCGKLLGYWSENEICAKNKTYNQPAVVNCTSKTEITNCTANGKTCPATVAGQYSFYNLLACTTSPPEAGDDTVTFPSCFSKGTYSSLNCCGCNNWQSTAGMSAIIPNDPNLVTQCGIVVPSDGSKGTTPNAKWVSNVLPNLIWLKNACPSAYTYPYDDKSSTFTCPYRYAGGQSGVNYTVTFCPGQKTGGITA